MPNTGAIDGPEVHIVCVHRHNDVLHDLFNGEGELVEVPIQLVYITVIFVSHISELIQATKLDEHHRHEPVGKEHSGKNDSRGLPQTEVCPVLHKKLRSLATIQPCMWWVTVSKGSPYLQVIEEMRQDGGPPACFFLVSHDQSTVSAGMAQITAFKAVS